MLRFQLKKTQVTPFNFSRKRDDNARGLLIATRGVQFPYAYFSAAAVQKQIVSGGPDSKEIAIRSLLQKNPLTASHNDQLSCWIGGDGQLVWVKNAENADANRTGLGLRKQREAE